MIEFILIFNKMDMADIIQTIGLHIYDYKALYYYCTLNHQFQNICNTNFWINFFNYHTLQLPQILPDTIEEWLYEVCVSNDIKCIIHKIYKNNMIYLNVNNSFDLSYFKSICDDILNSNYSEIDNIFYKQDMFNIKILYYNYNNFEIILHAEKGSIQYIFTELSQIEEFLYYVLYDEAINIKLSC